MKVVSARSTFLQLLRSSEVSPIGCRLLEVEVDSAFRKHYNGYSGSTRVTVPEALDLLFRKYCDCCSGDTVIAVPEVLYLPEVRGTTIPEGRWDTRRSA